MQAFLREELIVFCRDAPPEFNEHQRDVFCVFSGNGVARLRQFLNEQKDAARASPSQTDSVPPSVVSEGDQMEDIDDHNSDGSGTPVMVVDVQSQYSQGHTVLGPSIIPWQMHPYPGHMGTPSTLSQSAPSTSGPGWPGGPPPPLQSNSSHLAGMMGATALDEIEVDGDEAFGEGSELMDQD